MRWNYLAQYCWNSILGKTDRIFSFLSIFSIVVTITIFISLSGLLYSFKVYTEEVLNKLPLNIEVFKTKNTLLQDISFEEKKIKSLDGVVKIVKRIPTFLSFYDNEGKVVEAKDIPKGTTCQPMIESVIYSDISKKEIELQSKESLNSRFDEVGIIVSFYFLQKLGYIPRNAISQDPTTWGEGTIPEKLYIQVVDRNSSTSNIVKLPVPLIGVVENISRGEYIVAEDFYNLLLNWHYDFQYLLTDRAGEPLIKINPNIYQSYYVLNQDQLYWLEENVYDIENFSFEYDLSVYLESWQLPDSLEERLTLVSYSGDYLQRNLLDKMDKKLRTLDALKDLGTMKHVEEQPIAKTWEEFSSLKFTHQYMQATISVQDRDHILKVLDNLRSMGLFASSPLEVSLNTFKRQEKFYIGATLVIFLLIVFLSGIVLFSTFYTSVQRKSKQIGLLKAIGSSNVLIVALFMIESALITLISSPLGIFAGKEIGSWATGWINRVAKFEGSQIEFILPEVYITMIVGAVFVFSWLAVWFPIEMAVKIEPAQAVRS